MHFTVKNHGNPFNLSSQCTYFYCKVQGIKLENNICERLYTQSYLLHIFHKGICQYNIEWREKKSWCSRYSKPFSLKWQIFLLNRHLKRQMDMKWILHLHFTKLWTSFTIFSEKKRNTLILRNRIFNSLLRWFFKISFREKFIYKRFAFWIPCVLLEILIYIFSPIEFRSFHHVHFSLSFSLSLLEIYYSFLSFTFGP